MNGEIITLSLIEDTLGREAYKKQIAEEGAFSLSLQYALRIPYIFSLRFIID